LRGTKTIDIDSAANVHPHSIKLSFGKADRILKRREFLHIGTHGRKLYSPSFIAIFHPNQLGHCRLGVTVTRKVGKAAKRNRIKRLSREIFRLSQHSITGTWDINFIAKKGATSLTYHSACDEITRLLSGISGYYNEPRAH
jgi:ribonuclease P protein component